MSEIALILLGLAAGLLASSLGIGGGIIFVPALVVVTGLEQATAQGTSLAVIAATAVTGTLGHAKYGRVDWHAALPIAAGGMVGAVVGASAALALHPTLLRRGFAILLVVLAVRLIRQERSVDRNVDPTVA